MKYLQCAIVDSEDRYLHVWGENSRSVVKEERPGKRFDDSRGEIEKEKKPGARTAPCSVDRT
jgi:hypothetical protein